MYGRSCLSFCTLEEESEKEDSKRAMQDDRDRQPVMGLTTVEMFRMFPPRLQSWVVRARKDCADAFGTFVLFHCRHLPVAPLLGRASSFA